MTKETTNKKVIIIGVVVAVAAIVAAIGIGIHNTIIAKGETVDSAYSTIETTLQRRNDLIPNLVSTVKGYATHEEQVFADVTKAREALLGAKGVDATSKANSDLNNALGRLLAIAENYPDLKASANFLNLQDELAGTENRINVARQEYNDKAREYNTYIKQFPQSLLKGGATEKQYFEAEAGATEVPKVEF
ncbi:MAG: LemA family protein [Candidatus Nomurabacteria bacterium]|jgi:LemA protein|nr:LemA family protein [Candidatus Nomurabacteria bacterium]